MLTPKIDVQIDERVYRITALPSLRQRNLLLRLVKNFSGVLPLAKSEFAQALSLNFRKSEADQKYLAAFLFITATSIDQIIDNLKEEEMNFVFNEFLSNTMLQNPDTGVFSPVLGSKDNAEDPFSNRLGHLLKVIKAHMEFNYGDFLGGSASTAIKDLLAKLDDLRSQMDAKAPSSKKSTGSTTA